MMFVVKNLEELASGNIKCKLLAGGTWGEFIMAPLAEYELHDSSEWTEIKPCPQSEKDAHESEQVREVRNQEALTYLQSTDWYVLRQMDSGEPIPDDVKQLRSEARAKVA